MILAPVGGWSPVALAVTAGHAVKAMVLNGLGFVNHQFYRVPHFFRHKPTSRLIAPAIAASHLNDDTLGRALNTLYAYGVTELYSLIAATAANRLGLAPTFVHLDSTSFQGGGRDSRDHRPDLNQVMLDRMVEHQAGIPVLMKPLSGHISMRKTLAKLPGTILSRCTSPMARPTWWPIVRSRAQKTLRNCPYWHQVDHQCAGDLAPDAGRGGPCPS